MRGYYICPLEFLEEGELQVQKVREISKVCTFRQ